MACVFDIWQIVTSGFLLRYFFDSIETWLGAKLVHNVEVFPVLGLVFGVLVLFNVPRLIMESQQESEWLLLVRSSFPFSLQAWCSGGVRIELESIERN